MKPMWDERYDREDYLFGTEPNAFLRREAGRLSAGQRVLAVADGEGRNGVFLARQGLSVTALDSSRVAIAKAERLAASAGVTLDIHLTDVDDWDWPQAAFDAVVAIFIQFAPPDLRARLFRRMKQAVKPGGLILLEGYRPKQLDYGTGGPPWAEHLYTEALLEEAFADFDILTLEAYDAVIEEGAGHSGMSALIDLVARRPKG